MQALLLETGLLFLVRTGASLPERSRSKIDVLIDDALILSQAVLQSRGHFLLFWIRSLQP